MKETTKMTVTRALSTLKLLDKRINKSIANSIFANYTVGGVLDNDNYTPNEDLQAVNDLIQYRAKLKTAIMSSNSTTKVKVGKVKMTVVQAIETKDSILYKKNLLHKILGDLRRVTSDVELVNEDVKDRLDKIVQASFGSSEVSKSSYESISKPFLEKNSAKTVDSEKFIRIALDLEEEIDTFESEVDLVLSESNATTTIEVK